MHTTDAMVGKPSGTPAERFWTCQKTVTSPSDIHCTTGVGLISGRQTGMPHGARLSETPRSANQLVT